MTKINFVFIIIIYLISIQQVYCDSDKETIEQKLDHFNPEDDRIFEQDYEYDINYDSKIVFLYLSGEKVLNKSHGILSGQIPTTIPVTYFNLIHRFYGPTEPKMPSSEYIKYLNISQSLEDIKNFIEKMNEKFSLQSSSWIIAGCFYSGTLATLARQKFPSLIKGAVAVSAPLKPNLYIDYMDTVIEKMNAINENKTLKIQNAIEKYYNFTATLEGQEYLQDLLKDDYFMKNDTECFPANYDPTKFFAEVVEDGAILEFFEKWDGNDFEDSMKLLVIMGKRNKNKKKKKRQAQNWQHQICTEFGLFRTTSSQKSLDFFGDAMPKACPEIICDQLEKHNFTNTEYTFEDTVAGVEKTVILFGNPEKFNVTNVIFIIPEFDPWEQSFLLVTENPGIEIIFADNQFHCRVDGKSEEKWISKVLQWIN